MVPQVCLSSRESHLSRVFGFEVNSVRHFRELSGYPHYCRIPPSRRNVCRIVPDGPLESGGSAKQARAVGAMSKQAAIAVQERP